jgi:hypothetical protein
MNDHAPSARAWPFLVARGRRRGYRTLLAPDFLVAERDYGVLDDTVVPSTREDQATVVEVLTGAGRPLTVVHATHLVTSADIADPGSEPATQAPRDEHSRPLQLIYGFVCADGAVPEPDDEDLRASLATSLAAYRRFLDDEDGFAVEAGREFQPRSLVVRWPASYRQPAHALSTTGHAAVTGDETTGSGAGRPVVTRGGVLLAAGVVLVAVVLAIVWLARPKAPVECDPRDRTVISELQPPGSPTPTPTTTCLPSPQQKKGNEVAGTD